jgi:repressor LexA
VIASSRSDEDAEADLSSADQVDVARERELFVRLARHRAASGLSQAKVARLMQTSQPAVARLESGQHDAQLSTVIRYAEALGLSLDFVEDMGARTGDSTVDAGAEAGGAGLGEHLSVDQPSQGTPSHVRLRRRPGRKPKDSFPGVVTEIPGRPDPDHVITWRQRKILHVISEFTQHRGYPPSMREIAEAVGLTSTSSVAFQLSTLQSKGYLRRDAGRPRTVESTVPGHPVVPPAGTIDEDIPLNAPSQEITNVPLIGRIPGDGPILTEESIDEIVALPRQLVGEGSLFLLNVADDSMTGAAIADGDRIVVRQQQEADNGNIVAVIIDGETTVRTFRRSGDQVWLMPHHPAYTPTPTEKPVILGRVVAVLRSVP